MKRWLPLVVLAAGLGVGGFLWPTWSPKSRPVLSVQMASHLVKGVADDPRFDPQCPKTAAGIRRSSERAAVARASRALDGGTGPGET